jgi:hypothetical protein
MNRLSLSTVILLTAIIWTRAQITSFAFSDSWRVHSITEAEGRLYAATNAGLFHSDDEGVTWKNIPEMRMKISGVVALKGKVYATEGEALYRQDGRDGKWERIARGSGVNFNCLRVVGSTLVTSNSENYWTSYDEGLNWTKAPTTLEQYDTRSLGVSPQGDLFASGWKGHYLSKDSGDSWDIKSSTGGHNGTWGFQSVFSSDGSRVYFISDGGHVRIWPGDSIVFSNPNGTYRPVLGLIGKHLLVGFSGGMSRSSENGGSFHAVGQGLGIGRTIELAAGSLSIFARQTDGIYRSQDSGATWQKLISGDSVSRGLAVRGQEVVFIMQDRLYHSLDDGGQWTWEADAGHPLGEDITRLGTSQLALTSQGLVHKAQEGDVWFSRNQGRSWDSIEVEENPIPFYTWKVILAVNGDRIYLVWGKGIRVSDDFGQTWKDPNTILAPVLSSLMVVRGLEIYASTMYRIHHSKDGGKTWTRMSQEGLHQNARISALALSGDTLFVGMIEGVVGNPDGGLYYSVGPGSAWQQVPANPLKRTIDALHAIPGKLLAGQMNGPMFAYSISSRTWTEVGPDSAINVHGFFDGPTRLFAYSGSKGIFSSSDGGTTWEARRSGLAAHDVVSMAALDGLQIGTARDGLYTRSSLPDWTQGEPRFPGQAIWSLTTDGTDLFAILGTGEFAWLPRGGAAHVIRMPETVAKVNALAAGGGKLYAATNAGLFTANLPGSGPDFNWRLIRAGAILAVAAQGTNMAMLSRNSTNPVFDLHLSRDAGTTFPDSLSLSSIAMEKIILAYAAGGDLLIGGLDGLKVVRNADKRIDSPFLGMIVDVHSIAVRGGTWAIGTNKGVEVSKDGVVWKTLNSTPVPAYAVAFSGDTLFAGSRGRVQAVYVDSSSVGIDRSAETGKVHFQTTRLIGFESPEGYMLRYSLPRECRLTLTLATLDGRSTKLFTGLRHSGGLHVAKVPKGLRGPIRYILEVFPVEGRATRTSVQSGWIGPH